MSKLIYLTQRPADLHITLLSPSEQQKTKCISGQPPGENKPVHQTNNVFTQIVD